MDAERYNQYFSNKAAHHIRPALKLAVEEFYQKNPKRRWTEDWTQDDTDFAVKTLDKSSGRDSPDCLDISFSSDDIGKF